MDVKTALTNYETATDNLTVADGNLDQAKAKQSDAQSKLDAAISGTASAQQADVDAATSYNAATDELIAALTSTKRTVPTPPPAPPAQQ